MGDIKGCPKKSTSPYEQIFRRELCEKDVNPINFKGKKRKG